MLDIPTKELVTGGWTVENVLTIVTFLTTANSLVLKFMLARFKESLLREIKDEFVDVEVYAAKHQEVERRMVTLEQVYRIRGNRRLHSSEDYNDN